VYTYYYISTKLIIIKSLKFRLYIPEKIEITDVFLDQTQNQIYHSNRNVIINIQKKKIIVMRHLC